MATLIKDLNGDLAREYGAAIQYVQHAACISGAQYESIQKELLVHANEEIAHAVLLSDQISSLGGVPTVEVGDREVAADSLKMLKQDLAGEEDAIRRYKTRIAQVEQLQEYGLRRILEDILIQEEEHRRDLLTVTEG